MRALAQFALLLAAPAAAAPAFDCDRADGEAAAMVCADPALSALDRELARLHAQATGDPSLTADRRAALSATRRGWIRGRDDCRKADDPRACVRDAYALRIMDLRDGRAEDAAGISRGPFPFVCEGLDAPLSVGFVTGPAPLAVLRAGDVVHVLPAARAASGALYGDDVATFWTQGDAATATLDGRDLRCARADRG